MIKFEDIHEFYSNIVGAAPNRINSRYRGIISWTNFKDKRVLDLGSYDGRWSVAAKLAGAKEVIGVEARDESIDLANEIINKYGIDGISYVKSDIIDYVSDAQNFDIVLCCGVFYHIVNHYDLIKCLSRITDYIILDTVIWKSNDPIVYLIPEPIEWPGASINSVDKVVEVQMPWGKVTGEALAGIPSLSYIATLLSAFNFKYEEFDYSELDSFESMYDYKLHERVTLKCQLQK